MTWIFSIIFYSLITVPFFSPVHAKNLDEKAYGSLTAEIADFLAQLQEETVAVQEYNLLPIINRIMQNNELSCMEESLVRCYDQLGRGISELPVFDLADSLPFIIEFLQKDQSSQNLLLPALDQKQISRAPRTDAQVVTDPHAIAGDSCDLTKVLELLAIIRSRIGNVFQAPEKRTVLSTLGDPVELGPGLNIVRKLLLLQKDFAGVFTVLNNFNFNVTATISVDFTGVFTVLNDIKSSLTSCCNVLINDFNGVFTVLNNLHVTTTVDLSGVFTVLADIKSTLTTCCANETINFAGTFTVLNDIKSSLTSCCNVLINDFNGVFTVLNNLHVTTTVDLSGIFTVLADIKSTLTSCCATEVVNFAGTFTLLNDIRSTLTSCCQELRTDFAGTFTFLTDIRASLTSCCSTIFNDFVGVFTVLNDIKSTLTVCCANQNNNFAGTFTVLTDIRNTLTSCCNVLITDFTGVFTALNDIRSTLTACCAEIRNDFSGVFTVLHNLVLTCTINFQATVTTDLTSVFTVLADIKSTLTTCCFEIFNTLTQCCACEPTPVGADGLPFTISSPGVYCLANNISTVGATAITIASDDVYLDLNNHELFGNDSTSVGIDAGITRRNLTIKNGIIKNFTLGGFFLFAFFATPGFAENIVLENITTMTCGFGGFVIQNTNNLYCTNCKAFFNNISTGNGMELDSITNSVIKDCEFNFNLNGLLIESSSPNPSSRIKIINCRANNNTNPFFAGLGIGFDLALFGGSAGNQDIELIDCEAIGNGQRGFDAVSCNKIIYKNCTALLNGDTAGFDSNGFNANDSNDILYDHCISVSTLGTSVVSGFSASSIAGTIRKIIYNECISNDNFSTTTAIGFNLTNAINSCVINSVAKHNQGTTSEGIGINLLDCTNCSVQYNFVLSNTGASRIGIAVRNTGGAGLLSTSILSNRAQDHETNYLINPGKILLTTYDLSADTLTSSPTPHTDLHNVEVVP